jgi:ribosomal protein S6--L-glutamate ligase
MMEQVASCLLQQGKCVIERQLGEGGFPNDKAVPASKAGTYKVPETILVSQTSLPTILTRLTYPLVAKTLNDSMGRGVAKIDTVEALQTFALSAGETFLLQEYFELEYDTRVFVLGGKVLGAFNRYKPECEDFLTTRPGGRRESVVVEAAVAAAAIEAAALQGLVMAGVDLFTKDGHVYILEVNVSPQFVRFEKATGINAAAAIVAHITGTMIQGGSTV